MPDPSTRNGEGHIVPSISMTVPIDFHVVPVPFIGRLWDVSSSGALFVCLFVCLCVRSFVRSFVPSFVSLGVCEFVSL